VRYLLDTHALIWFISDADRLSTPAREAIQNGEQVYASHASLWEMSTKAGLGKLTLDPPTPGGAGDWFARNVPAAKLLELAISSAHLARVEFLPDHHRDPFDRLLIAQAIHERLTLITQDPLITQYEVATLW
jgi:PIN domain nuclease of toxin-antitoxin system